MPEGPIAFHDGLNIVALVGINKYRIPIGTYLERLGQRLFLLQEIDRLGDQLQRHYFLQDVGRNADQATEKQRHHAAGPSII